MKRSTKNINIKKASAKAADDTRIDYQSLYENHPLIHITISLDKVILSINKKGAVDLGYDKSELIGKSVDLIYAPYEHERLKKQIQYVFINPGIQSSHEMKLVKKNGEEFWVRETIYSTTETESTKEVFIVCDNITYQKNAEANAKSLAQSLQNMLDASPLGVFIYSLNENNELILISTNQSAVDILKIDVYALISKSIDEIFSSLPDEVVNNFKEVIKTGKPLLNQSISYVDVHISGTFEFSAIKLSENTIGVFFTDISDKKNALAALSESELKYKTLFENSNDAILILKDKKVIDCNHKTTEVLGWYKDEIIGKSLKDFSPELQPDGSVSTDIETAYLNPAGAGSTQLFEWQLRTNKNSLFFAEIGIKRFNTPNETYLQVIVRDINDQKKADTVISEQRREISTLMSNLPGMAYRCANNSNWTMEFVSEGCYLLTGYKQDEIINDRVISYANIINKNDRMLVSDIVQNAIIKKEPFTVTYRIVTSQGIEKWVWEKGRGIFDSAGNLICIEGFITDITEKKLADEKINILAHAIKSVTECICITDLRDKIIFVNNSFCRVYGYTQSEIIGSPISVVRSAKNDPAMVKKIFPETLAGGWNGELINLRKDGSEFLVQLSTSLITDDNGNPIALAGVTVDITNKKKYENELKAAKQKAEELSKLKSDFLAGVSHELRTPLVGVLGFAEILKDEVERPDLSEMAERIISSSNRLINTINSILDISKIEANKFDVNLSILNLSSLVKESAKLYEASAAKKGLYLNTLVNNSFIFVRSDEQLLVQILNNLISNAIKFTEKGGVTLKLDNYKEGYDSLARIQVIDTGTGILKDDLEKIFDEYTQVGNTSLKNFYSSGLGLTLVKKFVDILGGQIKVESNYGSGSVFTILLPEEKYLHENVDTSKAVSDFVPDKDSESEFRLNVLPDVLLVENDEYSRDIVKLFLKNICVVTAVDNASEALKLAEKNDYKLFLMDINLGIGLSGLEITKKIKSMEKYNQTPVIALTAFAMNGDKEEFIQSGCTHYLSKPFSKKELIEIITPLLY